MRRYLIGIDGGGTKTSAVLSDMDGNILYRATTAGTNHQIIGIENAAENINEVVSVLLDRCGLTLGDISFIMMGLAGADFQEDIDIWEKSLPEEIAAVPHRICTDTWVALATGTPTSYGAISICGTGHNTAVRRSDGEQFSISALKFALGNFGGGRMIADLAMHAAFRDYEFIGEHTSLTEYLPGICGAADMPNLRDRVVSSNYTYQYNCPIPKLVAELAEQGDEVSGKLLRMVGTTQGEMTARLLIHAGLDKGKIPIVMAGSVYCGEAHSEIVGSFQDEVKRLCPEAECEFILLKHPPVIGSVMLAARYSDTELPEDRLRAFYDRVISTYEGADCA